MSLFSSILEKLGFGSNAQAAPTPSPSPGSAAAEAAPPPTAISAVDVVTQLEQKARQHTGEKLNWRSSIVDLLKLLDIDSSLAARKTLAGELHYAGSTEDTATMNMWLHREVMKRLAENGGNVPNDLLD